MDRSWDVNTATAAGKTEDNFNALLVSFYTRSYPSADLFAADAEDLPLSDVTAAVAELKNEVAALREETQVLGWQVQALQQRRPGGGSGGGSHSPPRINADGVELRDGGGGNSQPTSPLRESGVDTMLRDGGLGNSISTGNLSGTLGTSNPTRIGTSSGGGGRRGRQYRRKSLGDVEVFVSVADKILLLRQELDRLRQQEDRTVKDGEAIREALSATVEEAIWRRQELRLEVRQFEREMIGDDEDNTGEEAVLTVSTAAAAMTAEELLRYLERRHATQSNYLDKLQMQCQAVDQDIARAQQLVRQRRVAGEAFQAVDLEQLRIENEQFNRRMAAKNHELAELKGTSTRTVQLLNTLVGQLNELTSEHTRLKRESKSRSEYLIRCTKEVEAATTEAAAAEARHIALKAQHEAVKVPKIEDYMAQKAEAWELEKALKNWERKVQIAEGQASVVRQQMRQLKTQRKAALAYVTEKSQRRAAATAASAMKRRSTTALLPKKIKPNAATVPGSVPSPPGHPGSSGHDGAAVLPNPSLQSRGETVEGAAADAPMLPPLVAATPPHAVNDENTAEK